MGFNIRPDRLNLKEKVKDRFEIIYIGKYIWNQKMIAQAKRTINKWYLVKLKSFSTAKTSIIWIKEETTEWEKMLTHYTSLKG